MKREDALFFLQLAIDQLSVASTGVCKAEELPDDAEDGIMISIGMCPNKSEILILNDGHIVFLPSPRNVANKDFANLPLPTAMHLDGRPKGLGGRRCPTCKGKGSI